LTDQTAQDVQSISVAIQQQNAGALAAAAHRLKGASANVSAEGLRAVAAELESLGRNNTLAPAAALFPKLQTEFARFKTAGARITRADSTTEPQKQ
jgi:HPt (histidine-containing phosphotransfer) domain-containing protein